MNKLILFVAFISLTACTAEPRDVRFEIPDDQPVVDRFQDALDIVGELSASGFPKAPSDTGSPDDITTTDVTLSVVAELTSVLTIRGKERVYVVCTILNPSKYEVIADECRQRFSARLRN